MRARADTRTLFVRWLWLIYAPLGLLAVLLVLLVTGFLPRRGLPLLLVLAAWGALSVRLLLERRRRGLRLPAPRSVRAWASSLLGAVLAGAILFWLGAERLSTNAGVAMFSVGGFLMLLAVAAPGFKLVDAAARRAGRLIRRLTSPTSGR